jgi:D-sedoheptulose 7-phosphate isomerase
MFTYAYFSLVLDAISKIDRDDIEKTVDILANIRETGRLFIIGSGGGAGHASHAVCDFRKLCNIEAYSPYDNVSELTARSNDEGFETSIEEWLKVSKFSSKDCIMVFSVGGGTSKISLNISRAVVYAYKMKAKIVGIVGRDGGVTKDLADACILIQTSARSFVTPITEGLQAVIWHLLVSHPKLKINNPVW